MFKLDLVPLAPKLFQNKDARIDYLKYTKEQTDILQEIVKQAKAKQPLDNTLDFTCKHAQRIQELLVYVRDTCPNAIKPSVKKVLSHPETMSRKLGLKCFTSNYGSKPTCDKKNDRISQTPSRNIKNKVEAQPRNVNKKNLVVEPIRNVDVKQSLLNANSELICDTCCPDCSLVSGLRMFETHDREPLSAHELCYNLNKLAKDGLARGIPRLKFHKDHLCSAYALGKSKKSSHQPKAKDTNQEKLYLLHMDLCSPMRVTSINGKMYILVIVDDYLRFTWVRFLRSIDKTPEAIIKCIKSIQVHLNATVHNVRTDNETEFINQILREFYENVGILHQTSVVRTPQQNGVAKAINTACYTQNHSLICLRYNKTLYELMQDKKPDLSFFHVFGALCYPTNDNDELGKLDAKADIGTFVGYTPTKQAFRIYNKRTQKIIETIHVTFDELTATVPVVVAPIAVDLANTPMSTSIDQDAPSTKPKNFKQVMTKSSWIDAMQEEIHEFERLQLWELVTCPDKAESTEKHLNTVKWIFQYLKGTINMGVLPIVSVMLDYVFLLLSYVLIVFQVSRIMSSITAQQAKLNIKLVLKEKLLEIGKCNERLNPGKIQRVSTFQVVLDSLALALALALTPCYSTFFITADVLEVYMHHPEMKETQAYKTYLVSTEAPTGKSKRVKRHAKKSTEASVRGVVIRETPEMPLTKKKEKVDVTRDNSNNEQDSSGEDSDQENDSDDDKTQLDNENESDSEPETNESKSGLESDHEENKEDEAEVKDEFVKTPSNDSDDKAKEEGADAAMTNVQQGKENPEILQVITDAHVTLSTIPQKIEFLVTSSSYSSDLVAQFLNFSDIPHIDAGIVSPRDVHFHRERSRKYKDEDPSAGSDRGLKNRKTSKDATPATTPKAKESQFGSSKGYKSHSKSSGKFVQLEELEFKETVASKRDWFTKPTQPQEPTDPDWNIGKTPQQGQNQSCERNRLMRSDELYKFSYGTLTRPRTSLDDITKNVRMEYLPKRRWSTLEKKRANIMIKAIDKQLKERRMIRSLKKFVGGRD
nr:retrovirus-related Pol polyprotein from transposon TNT 1-94 [Tanacetum cinerariifolium]